MAVEIQILSGARSGERIVLDQSEFRVGTDSHCEILFDPRPYHLAKGRSVLFQLKNNGWFIKSTGAGEVLLNQTAITKEIPIRSGDLVRLSELGPDFSFTIVTSSAAVKNKVEATSPVFKEAETKANSNTYIANICETTADDSSLAEVTSKPKFDIIKDHWKWLIWVGIVAATVILFIVRPWYQDNKTESTHPPAPVPMARLEIEAISDQTAKEGSQLTLRLQVKSTGTSAVQPVFILTGQPPDGAHMDHQTGEFTWTPTEEQGPREYKIYIQVSVGDTDLSSVQTDFRVEVKEVNEPPKIGPIEEKTIEAGKESVFLITASDSDIPINRQTFYLSDGPDWIRVDQSSGIVHCIPPETVDGRFEAIVCVRDDGQPPLEGKAAIGLLVHGDPWIRAQKELRNNLYIIQVEKGGYSWPHATCCGIGDHTLLTTALEVVDLAHLHRQGYQIWAVHSGSGSKTAVQAFCVPKAVTDLPEPADYWFYVNLGLLETEEQLAQSATMASSDELRSLEEGLPVACIGFSQDRSKITRFDKFEPQWIRGEIFIMRTSPQLGGNFRLLELKAKIPENMRGSPIVNQQGAVIAVYSMMAPLEGVGMKDLHYATVLDPQLVKSWLDGKGTDTWITPRLPDTIPSLQPMPQPK